MNKLWVKTSLWTVVGIITIAAYSIANLSTLVNRCDINRDGVVNVQDLVLVTNHMGEKSDFSERTEEVISEVTFDNALTLLPGEKYRLRFSDYQATVDEFGRSLVSEINWGSVNRDGSLVRGFTIDDPKVNVSFIIFPKIYYKTLDGERVFECEDRTDGKLLCDEIIITIRKRGYETKSTGGPRDQRFTYTQLQYHAMAIGNLTHPDRTFEYELTATWETPKLQ